MRCQAASLTPGTVSGLVEKHAHALMLVDAHAVALRDGALFKRPRVPRLLLDMAFGP